MSLSWNLVAMTFNLSVEVLLASNLTVKTALHTVLLSSLRVLESVLIGLRSARLSLQ